MMTRSTMKYSRTATALALCSVLLGVSSCSPSENETAPPEQTAPSETVSSDDAHRDDLTEERVIEWDRHEVVSDTELRVFFLAGSEECYGVRSVVEETQTEIHVAVIEGVLPDSPDVCTMEARNASLLVETDQPIDDRKIVPLADPELQS